MNTEGKKRNDKMLGFRKQGAGWFHMTNSGSFDRISFKWRKTIHLATVAWYKYLWSLPASFFLIHPPQENVFSVTGSSKFTHMPGEIPWCRWLIAPMMPIRITKVTRAILMAAAFLPGPYSALSHFMFKASLWGRCNYYPDFRSEETEAQRD